jgi:hypothetical protein
MMPDPNVIEFSPAGVLFTGPDAEAHAKRVVFMLPALGERPLAKTLSPPWKASPVTNLAS